MRLCERCREEVAECQPDDRLPFCGFTVIGGFLGGISAVATGGLLLVPAGLIAGALTDVSRCSRCGVEEDDENPHYVPMEEEEDEGGGALFSPLSAPGTQGHGTPDATRAHGSVARPATGPFEENRQDTRDEDPTSPEVAEPHQEAFTPAEHIRYRYDETEQMLVPVDPDMTNEVAVSEYEWSVGHEFDLDNAEITLDGVAGDTTPDQGPSFADEPGRDVSAGDAGFLGPEEGGEVL